MSMEKDSLSVWPGYVAAVSCLVLSLLLLASIVVSMLSQVASISADYNKILLESALKKFIAPEAVSKAQPTASATAPATRKQVQVQSNAVPSQTARSQEPRRNMPQALMPIEQLKLVFASDLAKVPPAQQEELVRALTLLAAPIGVKWRVWAIAQEGDERAKRTTFELMASVRGVMARKGFDEAAIDLRLMLQRLAPANAAPGEIVIFVAPVLEKGAAGGRS
jgi:hypothetical protein